MCCLNIQRRSSSYCRECQRSLSNALGSWWNRLVIVLVRLAHVVARLQLGCMNLPQDGLRIGFTLSPNKNSSVRVTQRARRENNAI